MSCVEEKRLDIWFTWNHEKQEQRLSELSKQGIHLITPGLFRSGFVRDDSSSYTYRLDYRPNLRSRSAIEEYRGLYEDAGWKLVGQCWGWYYFRTPVTQQQVKELYTDKLSLKQHYRRLQQVFAMLWIAEFLIAFVNVMNAQKLPQPDSARHVVLLVVLLLGFVMCLIAYGYFKVTQKLRRLNFGS